MLKSFLIQLRRKPKVVREQVAMWAAGTFTLLVLAAWVFTVPGQFAGTPDDQSAGLFSNLREELSAGASDLGAMREGISELATSSEETAELVDPTVIPDESPTTSTATTADNLRPIRIATTSPDDATTTAERQ